MKKKQKTLLGGEYDKESWEEHWQDMPEFIQDDKKPYKQVLVSFENEEDYQKFSKLVEQQLTYNTKSLWYPKYNREPPSNYLYTTDES